MSADDFETNPDTGMSYFVMQEIAAAHRGDEMVADTLADDLEQVGKSPRRVRRHPAYRTHHRYATEMVEAMWDLRPMNPFSVGGPGDFVEQLNPDGIGPALDAFLGLEWVAACAFELAEIADRLRADLAKMPMLEAYEESVDIASPASELFDDSPPPGHLVATEPFAPHAPPASSAALGELALAA